MRSWLGAVAAVALVLAAPGVAVAGPDDPAQIQFKLPNRAAIAEFEALGLNMDHAIHDTADGGALVSAWVTDAQLANLEMRGYDPVATIADKNAIDRIRAERDKTISDLRAAERALRGGGRGAKSLAPGTVRAQRADYYENNVGRFLSIEGYTTQAQITCTGNNCDYTGPPLVAEYYDAAGNRLGGGTMDEFIDPGVLPRLLPVPLLRLPGGQQGRRRRAPGVDQDRRPERRLRHAWTSASGSPRTRHRRARASCRAS